MFYDDQQELQSLHSDRFHLSYVIGKLDKKIIETKSVIKSGRLDNTMLLSLLPMLVSDTDRSKMKNTSIVRFPKWAEVLRF